MSRINAGHPCERRRKGPVWITRVLLVLTLIGLLAGCGAQTSRTASEPTRSASTIPESVKPSAPAVPAPELQTGSDKTSNPEADYIANKNTHKFHYPWCSSVDQMNEENKWYFNGTADELMDLGYDPCGRCHPAPESTPVPQRDPEPDPAATVNYIANTNTHKFHYPGCSSVNQMNESNKWYFTGTRDELIAMGYDPCGRCHP